MKVLDHMSGTVRKNAAIRPAAGFENLIFEASGGNSNAVAEARCIVCVRTSGRRLPRFDWNGVSPGRLRTGQEERSDKWGQPETGSDPGTKTESDRILQG